MYQIVNLVFLFVKEILKPFVKMETFSSFLIPILEMLMVTVVQMVQVSLFKRNL